MKRIPNEILLKFLDIHSSNTKLSIVFYDTLDNLRETVEEFQENPQFSQMDIVNSAIFVDRNGYFWEYYITEEHHILGDGSLETGLHLTGGTYVECVDMPLPFHADIN